MPKKITGEDGNEIEVYTQEEIESLVSEKTKEKDATLSAMQAELEELKKDEGKRDWASTRTQMKDLQSKIEALTTNLEAERKKFAEDLRTVRTSVFQGTVDSMLSGLSSGDVELSKKIKYHYDRLGGADAIDEKDAAEKMKDAYLLATGKQAPNPLAVARGASFGSAPKTPEPASQAVSELGRRFGITEDDVKKYTQKAADKKTISQ